MALSPMPRWMENLGREDMEFIRRFVLESGSLKAVARQYSVTYPTVRLRLDRIIQKINAARQQETDSYISLIKNMALDDRLDFGTAKVLIEQYKKSKGDKDL